MAWKFNPFTGCLDYVSVAPAGSDYKVSISANDTTPNTLDAKLTAGNNVTLTELNDGANEQMQIDVTSSDVTVWKDPVNSMAYASPPAGLVVGDRFIINPAASGDWYNPSWIYRQKITIDKDLVSDDLVNFPVLIKITASDNPLFSHALANGNDILFTSSDKTTKLKHEVGYFETADGSKQLEAYVKIADLSDSVDTVIYMYYGNAAASDQSDKTNVWTEDYRLVYHMKDLTTSTVEDSVGTSNGDKAAVNLPSEMDGQTGKAQSFNGSTAYIDTNDTYNYSGNGAFSVFIWTKDTSIGNKYLVCQTRVASYASDWILGFVNGGLWFRGLQVSGANLISDGNWHQLGFVFNGTTAQLYIDGATYGSPITPSIAQGINSVKIHARGDLAGKYPGAMDDCTISTVARTLAWIETEYANQNSPATFFSLDPEEIYSTGSEWDSYPNYITEVMSLLPTVFSYDGPPVDGWATWIVDIEKQGNYSETEVMWVTDDSVIIQLAHNQLSGLQPSDNTYYGHLEEDEHAAATRLATNEQSGLMPSGLLDSILEARGFKDAFVTTDWTLDGNLYYLEVLHSLEETAPAVEIYEGTDQVHVQRIERIDSNTIKLYIPSTPDLRFEGQITILKS